MIKVTDKTGKYLVSTYEKTETDVCTMRSMISSETNCTP